jgi:hypothetical protein
MRNFKKYFLMLLLAELLLSYSPVYAQALTPYRYETDAKVSDQIKQYLCTPSPTTVTEGNAFKNANQGDLYECINRLYKFAIILSCVVGVFFIVIAGYVYMGSEGNQESVEKAKSILTSTLTSIVILLTGFVLLKAINPDLIQFQTIQPQSVVISDLPEFQEPSGGGIGWGGMSGSGSTTCSITEHGACTRSVISQCPEMARNMDAALRACNHESAGGQVAIPSGTDQCTETTTNKVVSFSWGLWQLNIAAGSTAPEFSECNGVLRPAGGPWSSTCLEGTCGRTCTYGSGGPTAFNACVLAVADPARNTKQACTLFKQRGWAPWPWTRNICSLP